MLHRFRRLRLVVVPLFAGALAALGIRLGYAHDPSCPHHASHAPAAATTATPHQRAAQAGHAAHRTDASHAAHAAVAMAKPAHGDSPPASPDAPCRCLDPDSCITGVVAVLDADSAGTLLADAWAFDAAPRPMPVSVTRPDAYSTHRLPFPHAPPGFDDAT